MKGWIGLGVFVVVAVIVGVGVIGNEPATGDGTGVVRATAADPVTVMPVALGPAVVTASSSDRSGTPAEIDVATDVLPDRTNAEPDRLSLEQASAHMRQRLRDRDCRLTREANQPEKTAEREETEWQWLPAESVAAERAAFAESSRRMLDGCHDDPADEEQRRILDSRRAVELAAAVAAGDLQARIEALDVPRGAGPDYPDELYPLARDVFASKDPEALYRLGRLSDRYGQGMGWRDIPEPELVWSLVACDLGRDCGSGSRALDQDCLAYGGCGHPNLESALRDRVSPHQFESAQTFRQGIVEHYRAGELERFMQRDPRMRGSGGG